MRVSFKISNRATWCLMLSGAILGGLGGWPAHGRPIEFSEPANSNLTTQVSGLGAKPSDLPSVEDRVFKPHSYSSRDPGYDLKPLTGGTAPVNVRRNPAPGAFDRDNNWMQMSPDKMLMQQLERDALKLPSFENGNNAADVWSSWDPYNLKSTSRNGPAKINPRDRSPEINRPDSATDALNSIDPIARYTARHASSDGSLDFSPEALERKQQVDHLEEFKRTLNFQTPGMNPILPAPMQQTPRGNAFVSEVENPARSPAGALLPKFAAPVAPVAPRAPTAPLAPGQTSLTPSPYSPPAKLKPVVVTAPRRSF